MQQPNRHAALENSLQGNAQALGLLLESFRPYVRMIVRTFRDQRLQARLDESDLIQDVMLEAYCGFPRFRGTTEAEFVVWLRQIVIHSTTNTLRAFLETDKRNPAREEPTSDLDRLLGDASTPSAQAIRREEAALLVEALAHLPDDMQQVLLGRHAQNQSHAEIAERLGRSEAGVRVLYVRALDRLREFYPCKSP